MKFKFIFSNLLVFLLGVATQAQDGKHLLLKYNIENTGWKMDNYKKVSTTSTYPELSYFMTWGSGKGGGSAEFYAPGIFSGISGNVYITAEDDSLQITNINMLGFVFQQFMFSTDGDVHNIGWSLGLDFLGHSLATEAEEGSFDGLDKDGAEELAQLKGMGLSLGATYQLNLDDQILVDAYLIYRLIYNSQSAMVNEKSFHGSGMRAHFRGRYYLNYDWVVHSELMIESLSHDPTDIPAGDIGGKMSFVTFSLGIGYQW
jgi:hypothetical protein